MNWLCAGVYAEGPTDDRFLCNLLNRILPPLAAEICKSVPYIDDARRISEPRQSRGASREERIAAAIEESWSECNLFVVHSDGEGAPDEVRRERIEPGLARARRARPDLAAAACVPVRETEAWMLADPEAFCRIFETDRMPPLPSNPEAESDPKKVLETALCALGARMGRGVEDYYALLGAEVRLDSLRRLPAFQQFEEELRKAIAAIAAPAGA
ncbi:DUF4276 family protein [Sorangium sp. So ce1014]|uniref:DUF4276 family protein n=1 Tax=Sorangium sp. So ce1014 TaxID=3133326 RepID=UPI003F6225B4